MLVREDVVGIVGPGAVIAERTDRDAVERFAGERAVRAIRRSRGPLQDVINIARLHRPPAQALVDGGGRIDHQSVAP